ncbi:hypothetical protein [Thermococcus sp. ES12]|uniref:hypothetical protein n=1 Tax=Thermococcus sp. ES12 TaxID=1638246 RepID=UPI0014304A92|nr:hypothetical protein [Thermococcus sp. ES12]NJE77358.1 hypothetical protein [Thermococcus sp. ES12]
MLVCVKAPAKSLPAIAGHEPDTIVVWYPGVYYIPYVDNSKRVKMLRGVNGPMPYLMDTETPLVITTYNRAVTVEFRENSSDGVVSVFSALPIRTSWVEETAGYRLHKYLIPPLERSVRPGYYPFFVAVNSSNETVVLLMWVALLEKPIVKITDYPTAVWGNGVLTMKVRGVVYYPDGRPVRSGVVTVTLNESKGIKGVFIGSSQIHNGTFEVNAFIGSTLPPGDYQLIAYYRGYEAYPSDSDPTVVILREPEVSVTQMNGTIRLFLHWDGHPLSNRTLKIATDLGVIEAKTDERGYVFLNLTGVESIRIVYDGDRYYLPLNRTVSLAVPEKRRDDENKNSLLERIKVYLDRVSGILWRMYPLLMVGAAVGVGYSIYSKRKNRKSKIAVVPKVSVSRGDIKFVEPLRRVFLPGEMVRVVLSEEGELFLDGLPVGRGRQFEFVLGAGRHKLSTGDSEIEVHVLPPKDAVIKAYELHFLPFAVFNGVPERPMTPYEIERLLRRKGLDGRYLRALTEIFVKARYSEHMVGEKHFHEFVEGLVKLGVLKSGGE